MPTRHRESPSARTNPSGKRVWVARYTGPDGIRRSAGTFDLKRQAQDAINAAYDQQPVSRSTVGRYAHDWTERYPRSPRTNRTNDGRIRQVLDVKVEGRPLRDWPLSDLRRRHALELVDHMLRVQGRATTGVGNVLRALSAMVEDAITDELVGSNVFRGVKVRGNDPRAVKPMRKPRVFSWDQMHHLAACSGQYEAMIRTLSDCGLRIGELFALRRSGLSIGVMCVAGSAWEGEITSTTRQKNHDRTIPIPPSLQLLLRQMPVRIDSDLLFPTPSGGLWLYSNWKRDCWNPARKASGIDATPHEFRHSFVSNLRAAGVDPADLAAVAGHSLETATARYTHPLHQSFETIRQAVG